MLHVKFGKNWLHGFRGDVIWKCWWRRTTISSPMSLQLRWATDDEISEIGPRQANLVLIAYASSEGSGEPAHPRSLARTFPARSYKQWVKRNLQTESQILAPLNGWACAVEICNDGMLEDTNSLDGAQVIVLLISSTSFHFQTSSVFMINNRNIAIICMH